MPWGNGRPPNLPVMRPRHTDSDREINGRISAQVRQVIKRFELNQSQVARKLGYDPSYISRASRSERGFSASFVVRLCQAYGLDPVVVLLGGETLPANVHRDPGDASTGQARPVGQKAKGGGLA